MKQRAIFLTVMAGSLAACQTAGPAAQQASAPNPPAFVEAACGGCHAVQPPFLSPNPEARSFEAIANREELSEATLASWLKDAHNYPDVMDFDLSEEQADEIAQYMVTLRRGDYRRVK
ncbi:MAG: hypothetical protein AAGK01_00025 [Pseudomonadota bacterium]